MAPPVLAARWSTPPGARNLRESITDRGGAVPIDLSSPETLEWVALLGALIVLFVVDLALVRGRGGEMSARTAALDGPNQLCSMT